MTTAENTFNSPESNPNLLPQLQALVGGWINRLETPLPTQPEKQTSRQTLMAAHLLTERFSQNEAYQPAATKKALLTEDLKHIACEALLGQTITSWTTTISPELVEAQAGNYQEDLGSMTHSFIESLTASHTTRPKLEHQNTLWMTKWAVANADTNRLLIWTSPPDTPENGYHGSTSKTSWSSTERHHTFFYVMRAKTQLVDGQETILLHTDQIRGWPNMADLIQIQTQLSSEQTQDLFNLEPNDGHITLRLVENMLELKHQGDYQQALQAINEIVFTNQAEWLFSTDNMPQVELAAFWQEFERTTTQLYLKEALPLFESVPTNISENDQYWYSTEYQQILEQLDILFDYWFMSLQHWIEDHDLNPQSQILTIKQLIQNLKNLPTLLMQKLHQPAEKHEQVPVLTVQRMYRIDVARRVFKNPLGQLDKLFYLQNLGALSLSGSFLSIAQCGIMTPFTLPFTVIRHSMKVGHFTPFELALQRLPVEMQQQLYSQFQQYVPLYIEGAKQSYMVPPSYLGQCTLVNGQILGPCGISLELDPDALPINQKQLSKFLGGFQSLLSQQKTLALKDSLLQRAASPSEHTQAKLLIQVVEGAFNKQSVGLTQLMANDTLHLTVEAMRILPTELLVMVHRSSASFNQLMQQLVKKLLHQHKDLLEKIPEFKQLQLQLDIASPQ